MTGVGEALLCEILAKIMLKSVTVAWTIVQDARNFANDRSEFDLRLQVQIARIDGVRKLLADKRIGEHVEARDRHTYFNVMQKMHSSLLNYALKTTQSDDTRKPLLADSAQELFAEYERRDPELLNPSRAQESFWLRTKERVTWAVFRKGHLEKLVIGVEQWGNCLNVLTSTIVPSIFTRCKFNAATIAEITPPPEAGLDINVKSDIMIAQRMELEALDYAGSRMPIVRRDTQPICFDSSQLTFRSPGVSGVYARLIKDGDENDPERTDLGGRSRRQWATFRQADGSESPVIVEFKERPRNPSSEEKKRMARELNSLVRELRLAAQRETIQVFYCEGYYDNPEVYGLVYRLPPSIKIHDTQCESLGSILLKREYNQLLAANLQNRIELAKALATTLLHLHSVQWVHKSLNPDNVLIFGLKNPDGTIEFNWNRPYLVGFDASRSNRAVTDNKSPNLRWENRVYLHPERQKEEHARFRKLFDIYSLGVMLLELGMLDCFKHSRYRTNSREWTDLAAAEVKRKFVKNAKRMEEVLGPLYAEIVLTCLLGQFDVSEDNEDADETLLLEAFRSEVCEKLDQIRI